MQARELSDRIDYALSKASGGIAADEYNKSLYATRAQSFLIEKALKQYEYGDAIRHLLGKLLVEVPLTATDIITTGVGFIELPLAVDIKQIIYEVTNTNIETIPLDHNDIHEVLRSSFRAPNSTIAYRVTDVNKCKLYTSETFLKYEYIYCKVPKPIVLEDLPLGLTIQGVATETDSELPYDTVLRVADIAAQLIVKDKAKFATQAGNEAKT